MANDYGDYFGTDDPMEISSICEGGMDPMNPFAAERQAEEDKRARAEARDFLRTIQAIFPDNEEIQAETEYLIDSDWPYLCLKNCIHKRETLDKALQEKNVDKVLTIIKYHTNFLRDLPF